MSEVKLNATTRLMIKDLQDDLTDLLTLGSNIEVIWKLEELHNNKALLKSSEAIRKSLK